MWTSGLYKRWQNDTIPHLRACGLAAGPCKVGARFSQHGKTQEWLCTITKNKDRHGIFLTHSALIISASTVWFIVKDLQILIMVNSCSSLKQMDKKYLEMYLCALRISCYWSPHIIKPSLSGQAYITWPLPEDNTLIRFNNDVINNMVRKKKTAGVSDSVPLSFSCYEAAI